MLRSGSYWLVFILIYLFIVYCFVFVAKATSTYVLLIQIRQLIVEIEIPNTLIRSYIIFWFQYGHDLSQEVVAILLPEMPPAVPRDWNRLLQLQQLFPDQNQILLCARLLLLSLWLSLV